LGCGRFLSQVYPNTPSQAAELSRAFPQLRKHWAHNIEESSAACAGLSRQDQRCGNLGVGWELVAPAALAVDLLDRAQPVFEVKGGSKFAVLHGEEVDRHDPEALSRGLGAIEVANRRAGSFAAHAYFVVDHDLFDRPAKVGDDKADSLEHFGEFVARKRVLIA